MKFYSCIDSLVVYVCILSASTAQPWGKHDAPFEHRKSSHRLSVTTVIHQREKSAHCGFMTVVEMKLFSYVFTQYCLQFFLQQICLALAVAAISLLFCFLLLLSSLWYNSYFCEKHLPLILSTFTFQKGSKLYCAVCHHKPRLCLCFYFDLYYNFYLKSLV